MNFAQALEVATKKVEEMGIQLQSPLNNPRQARKFDNNVGIVRQLAGLQHGNRVK